MAFVLDEGDPDSRAKAIEKRLLDGKIKSLKGGKERRESTPKTDMLP
jgi:hypothetical protein